MVKILNSFLLFTIVLFLFGYITESRAQNSDDEQDQFDIYKDPWVSFVNKTAIKLKKIQKPENYDQNKKEFGSIESILGILKYNRIYKNRGLYYYYSQELFSKDDVRIIANLLNKARLDHVLDVCFVPVEGVADEPDSFSLLTPFKIYECRILGAPVFRFQMWRSQTKWKEKLDAEDEQILASQSSFSSSSNDVGIQKNAQLDVLVEQELSERNELDDDEQQLVISREDCSRKLGSAGLIPGADLPKKSSELNAFIEILGYLTQKESNSKKQNPERSISLQKLGLPFTFEPNALLSKLSERLTPRVYNVALNDAQSVLSPRRVFSSAPTSMTNLNALFTSLPSYGSSSSVVVSDDVSEISTQRNRRAAIPRYETSSSSKVQESQTKDEQN